ncbi:MAG: shikimate dehydrogenase [Firmicutes bacterium]|nr:shikimate dehydrogenase [Bacillota bacterium]
MNGITGRTKVTGIIGYPLTYTLSPLMHNRAFNICSLNYVYVPFVVEQKDLKNAIEGLKALNIKGVNVTMPHKEAVLNMLDGLSEQARLIGAVNTINNEDGYFIGYNTDSAGFLNSLMEEGFDPANKTAIIIGTGGAAKAVAVALAQAGVREIAVIGRSATKAQDVKTRITDANRYILVKTLTFEENLADIFKKGELIVNATPVGMKESGGLLPVPLKYINAEHFIYDLIYTPQETALIKAARDKGARAINGLGMLVYQAAEAFEIWTGVSAPIDEMRQALIHGLKSGERPENV